MQKTRSNLEMGNRVKYVGEEKKLFASSLQKVKTRSLNYSLYVTTQYVTDVLEAR